MTEAEYIKLIAHSLLNGGNPDLGKLTKEQLAMLKDYLERQR